MREIKNKSPLDQLHLGDTFKVLPSVLPEEVTHRFFLFDPIDNQVMLFETPGERDETAENLIEECQDEGTTERIREILMGEITHRSRETDIEQRPPPGVLDERGYDDDGVMWGSDMEYRCNYVMKPLAEWWEDEICSSGK